MGATWGPNRWLYRALAISLALHLAVALFFPALATVQGNGPSIETISFVKVLRISVLPAHQVARERPAVAPLRAPVPAVSPSHAGNRTVRRVRGARNAAPLTAIVSREGSASVQPVSTAPPVETTATPAQATVASSETRSNIGGYMPLGAEEQNPVLDGTVIAALRALGVHTTLSVDVDENGKTKSVTFSPDIDASMEDKIRSMLANARWDPAVCGAGVACESQATIKI